MKMLVILIKEMAESFIRNTRLLFSGAKQNQINSSLKENGLVRVHDFYSKDECEKLRTKIDYYIADETTNKWIDESGSDHRIYFINEIDEDFNRFYEHPKIREALLNYTGTKEPSGMLLAARIDAKDGNLGSGGGWHRDSPITHQFKAICYLSNVDSNCGPFQYIRGSHRKVNVLKAYFLGLFKAGQYRFTEHEIESYLDKTDSKVTDFIATEGTVAFADTKGIHRGKPIKEGSRYVLFCYFWNKDIPTHFDNLRQK
ncbi:phytanoyl-CoA dioxygenase family protein [Pseudoalteromonas fuliginea]|uniref:phytanoyl-CoA dioxygenase family protein n=1 Tax=Pseudoalteromonas fuliginea TaxID=1872678 RepID=UPI00316BFF97